MIEIIPAIIAKNFTELKEKVLLVEPHVKWVQLDVMDGNFVPNFTWNTPSDLKYYDPGVFMEAHLMISEPEKHIASWLDSGVKRIIFHIEATSSPYAVIKACREKHIDVGVAINPETPQSSLSLAAGQADLQELVDMVLVLGVTPGFGGQKFKPEVIKKIKELRKNNPNILIEVDGGMNLNTAKKVVQAGANAIAVGSYILESDNIAKAVEEIKQAVA